MRVISPRNLLSSITIATRPRSNTPNKSCEFRVRRQRFQLVRHRASHRVVKMRRLAVHFYQEIGFIDDARSARPLLSTTGSCDTSESRIRLNAVSNESSGPTVITSPASYRCEIKSLRSPCGCR